MCKGLVCGKNSFNEFLFLCVALRWTAGLSHCTLKLSCETDASWQSCLHIDQPQNNQTFTCLTWTSMQSKLRSTSWDSWLNYNSTPLLFKCIFCVSHDTLMTPHATVFDNNLCKLTHHLGVLHHSGALHDLLSQLSEHLHSSTSLHTDALWESRRRQSADASR